MAIFSFVEAREIMNALNVGEKKVKVNVDLGLKPIVVDINHKFKEARFLGLKISFADVESISSDESVCYSIEKNTSPQKLKLFSADTGILYKLVPSTDAPSLEVSGISMHRTDGRTPWQDALDKVSSLAPLNGRVLDTCCCLGYTAIAAGKSDSVASVYTFERDSNVLEMTDYNPWSKELYTNRKIKLTIGDAFRGVEMFSSGFFDSVIHDPPLYSLSPQLYSEEFYAKLYRILKPEGKLFHYVGSQNSKEHADFAKDVIKKLKASGFRSVHQRPDILGVTAVK